MGYTRKLVDYPAGIPSPDWGDDAACRGDTTFDWFSDHRPSRAHVRFCAECPVRSDCLRAGLYEGQDSAGFRAGLPADARRRILLAHVQGRRGDIESELVRAGWSGGDASVMVRSFE